MSRITETVEAIAKPVVEAEGCSLWDVEYLKEAGTWYLRVYIDKKGGVSINDCETISRVLDPLLDEADPIPESYVFEVCSAGAERELKRPSDFETFFGSMIEARTYAPVEGSKSFVGELAGYSEGNVTLRIGSEMITLDKKNVSLVRLHADF